MRPTVDEWTFEAHLFQTGSSSMRSPVTGQSQRAVVERLHGETVNTVSGTAVKCAVYVVTHVRTWLQNCRHREDTEQTRLRTGGRVAVPSACPRPCSGTLK